MKNVHDEEFFIYQSTIRIICPIYWNKLMLIWVKKFDNFDKTLRNKSKSTPWACSKIGQSTESVFDKYLIWSRKNQLIRRFNAHKKARTQIRVPHHFAIYQKSVPPIWISTSKLTMYPASGVIRRPNDICVLAHYIYFLNIVRHL